MRYVTCHMVVGRLDPLNGPTACVPAYHVTLHLEDPRYRTLQQNNTTTIPTVISQLLGRGVTLSIWGKSSNQRVRINDFVRL